MKTQPLKKLLDRRIAELKSAPVGLDAFVLLWVEAKGRNVWGLTNSGEFDIYPPMGSIKIMTADEVVKESVNYDRLHDEKKSSMGLIIHAKCYRDILIRRVEEDRQRIDEILTRYDTD